MELKWIEISSKSQLFLKIGIVRNYVGLAAMINRANLNRKQWFYKTVIKFHNIHRTAKLWTTVTICWNIWHWWNDGWSQLSEMSRLQFPSSVHLLCVCQSDPITFLSFLCKILVYRIFYMCGHLPFKSTTSNDKYHTGLKSHITPCSWIHSKYKAWNYTLHIIQRQFCQYCFWWQFSQHLNLCHRFFGNKYEKIVSQSNVWQEENAFLYRALETNLCL